jgi:hypothetical protein
MGANAALDIAIALVLMYLVLSLIGTVINEFIATALKLRATTLQSAIAQIIDHKTLRDDFYNHGLIDGTKDAINGDHASYLAGDTFASALLSSLDPTKPIPAFGDIKTAVEAMPDCNIRDVLLAQLVAANGKLENLRNGVAHYFDNTMDRVSGLYKRYLKWISLLVGLLIVGGLNADSVAVGRALWNDSSLRDQMVQQAKQFATGQQPADDDAEKTVTKIATFVGKMEGHIRPSPIGWPDADFTRGAMSWEQMASQDGTLWLFGKFAGLLMTALAISLGAPFWFDMLSKFMNVRGAGVRPDRTEAKSA